MVYLREGTYTNTSGLNTAAVLTILISGTQNLPITFRNFPGEKPVIAGPCAYGIRIGSATTLISVEWVIIDGLDSTHAQFQGLFMWKGKNIIIRNSNFYTNNANYWLGGQTGSRTEGILLWGRCENVLVENCRIYDNGSGFVSYEEESEAGPVGAYNCTVRNCFIYANSNASQVIYGNVGGLAFRFGDHCTVEGNILYDNPDAGINGLGNNFCRFLKNISMNAWQEGGNQEGIKFTVRGGAANLVVGNLLYYNGNTGFDACIGVGDIVINNTFYKNDHWGILAEGNNTFYFNNLSYLNAVENNGQRDIRLPGNSIFSFMHPASDYNFFGHDTLPPEYAQAHTLTGNAKISGPDLELVREDIRQVIHPEEIFEDFDEDGIVSAEDARQDMISRIALENDSTAREAGIDLQSISGWIEDSIPDMIELLEEAAVYQDGIPTFQAAQAAYRFRLVKAELQTPEGAEIYANLEGLEDLAGNAISDPTPHMGAIVQGES